jgi:hypothetical protein
VKCVQVVRQACWQRGSGGTAPARRSDPMREPQPLRSPKPLRTLCRTQNQPHQHVVARQLSLDIESTHEMRAGGAPGLLAARVRRDSTRAHIGPNARGPFSQASPHSLPDTEPSHTSVRHSLQLPPSPAQAPMLAKTEASGAAPQWQSAAVPLPSPARTSTLHRPNPAAPQWQTAADLPPSPARVSQAHRPDIASAQWRAAPQRSLSLQPNEGPEAESSQPALLSPEASSQSGNVLAAEAHLPPRLRDRSSSPVSAHAGACTQPYDSVSAGPLSKSDAACPDPRWGRAGVSSSGVSVCRSRQAERSGIPRRASSGPTPAGEPWRSPGKGSGVPLGRSSISRSPKRNAAGVCGSILVLLNIEPKGPFLVWKQIRKPQDFLGSSPTNG